MKTQPTVQCPSCDRTGTPSASFPAICTRCWLNLPQLTRESYLHGGLSQHRLVAISRERSATRTILFNRTDRAK